MGNQDGKWGFSTTASSPPSMLTDSWLTLLPWPTWRKWSRKWLRQTWPLSSKPSLLKTRLSDKRQAPCAKGVMTHMNWKLNRLQSWKRPDCFQLPFVLMVRPIFTDLRTIKNFDRIIIESEVVLSFPDKAGNRFQTPPSGMVSILSMRTITKRLSYHETKSGRAQCSSAFC